MITGKGKVMRKAKIVGAGGKETDYQQYINDQLYSCSSTELVSTSEEKVNTLSSQV